MKVLLAAAVYVVVAAVAAAVPHASPIAPSFDIYSIGIDGSPPVRLTSDPANELSPALSPDGKTIAYSRGPDLWLMDADGSDERLLAAAPPSVSYKQPSWSANGRVIAFTAWDISACSPGTRHCASPSVRTVQSDGSGLRVVAHWAMTPRWSPRGQRLAFAGDVVPFDLWPTTLYTVSSTGSGRRLAHADTGVGSPSWAPNGRRLAYSRTGPTGTAVYTALADRPGSRRLRRGDHPAWSPRGDRIALTDRARLYLVRSRGPLRAKPVAFADWFSWNRRGDRLALVDWKLSVIRPNGRSFRVLCCEQRFGFADEAPAWSKLGDRVFYSFKLESPPPA
jgi:Tol biopolymer transport system component